MLFPQQRTPSFSFLFFYFSQTERCARTFETCMWTGSVRIGCSTVQVFNILESALYIQYYTVPLNPKAKHSVR
jgi:hypothetical protein